MELPIALSLCAAGTVIALLWAISRALRQRRIDARFGAVVSGGRGGSIKIRCNGRQAIASYEVGTSADFIVYRSSLAWANGYPFQASDRQALISVLTTWSEARGSKLEVANDAQ